MSFETSFDSKQPKLEPKLVSALSETKRLFRLFRFYTETESFDVSIEPKQTEDQPKQFYILIFNSHTHIPYIYSSCEPGLGKKFPPKFFIIVPTFYLMPIAICVAFG